MADSPEQQTAKIENIPDKADHEATHKLHVEVEKIAPQDNRSVQDAQAKQNEATKRDSLPDVTLSDGDKVHAGEPADADNQKFWHSLSREWLGMPDGATQDQLAKVCEGYGKDSSMAKFYDQLRTDPKYAAEVREQLQLPASASQEQVDQAFEVQRQQYAKQMGLPENASRVLMDDLANYADRKVTAQKLGLPPLDLRDVDARNGSRQLALEVRDHHIDQAIQYADLNDTLTKMGQKPVDMNKIPDEMRTRVLEAKWDELNKIFNKL